MAGYSRATAEEDRDQVRRHFANSAREKELLGSEQKIYHSDRFVPPTITYTPPATPSGKAWYQFW
ncbi:hypothetical protein VI817_007707 [Penicillium citrinum]|nr:hypothetical protein VI817_007707 [Penicillium citrinum]